MKSPWKHNRRKVLLIQQFENRLQRAYFTRRGTLYSNPIIRPFIDKADVVIKENGSKIVINPETTLSELTSYYSIYLIHDGEFLSSIRTFIVNRDFNAKLNTLLEDG